MFITLKTFVERLDACVGVLGWYLNHMYLKVRRAWPYSPQAFPSFKVFFLSKITGEGKADSMQTSCRWSRTKNPTSKSKQELLPGFTGRRSSGCKSAVTRIWKFPEFQDASVFLVATAEKHLLAQEAHASPKRSNVFVEWTSQLPSTPTNSR